MHKAIDGGRIDGYSQNYPPLGALAERQLFTRQSFLVVQEGRAQYPIFDTVTCQGHVFCGLAIGRVTDGGKDFAVTPVGQKVVERLAEYSDGATRSPFWIVEVKTMERVKLRVRQAFQAAKAGDAVLFICADSEVYDEVFANLGFRKDYNPFAACTH